MSLVIIVYSKKWGWGWLTAELCLQFCRHVCVQMVQGLARQIVKQTNPFEKESCRILVICSVEAVKGRTKVWEACLRNVPKRCFEYLWGYAVQTPCWWKYGDTLSGYTCKNTKDYKSQSQLLEEHFYMPSPQARSPFSSPQHLFWRWGENNADVCDHACDPLRKVLENI